jgi:hypothetical protein
MALTASSRAEEILDLLKKFGPGRLSLKQYVIVAFQGHQTRVRN